MQKRAMTISRGVAVLISIIALIIIALAIYLTFFYPITCKSLGCFQSSMENCRRATYVNNEQTATWGYRIDGAIGGRCYVTVTLLQANEGDIGVNNILGQSMKCAYQTGTFTYPGSDLSACTGVLKESLQDLIIQKLHTYIIENLVNINQNLTTYSI